MSVIVATFNRLELLQRLLSQLDAQTLDPSQFEVVVVDDGSTQDIPLALEKNAYRFHLVALRQENAGPAAARHRAIEAARGRVLVIVDDDMQVEPGFLRAHLSMHPEGSRRAALGGLAPDSAIADMPYFERWYARGHEKRAASSAKGTLRLDGLSFYTGNVSLERADYLAVGGFDLSLRIAEDTDLGLRLEKSGVELTYSSEAVAFHGSDHVSEEAWLKKARAYGVNFHRVGEKHPDVPHASGLRLLFEMNVLARPLIASSLLMPNATVPLSIAGVTATRLLWRAGLTSVAQPATSVVYTMEYMRGVRTQTGTFRETVGALYKAWRERNRK